jgi:hypothetical protein
MAIATGKLYSVKASTTLNVGKTARLELKGSPLSIIVYGSEELQDSVANMTACTEELTESSYYSLDTLPTYIAFIGTATRINIGGYDLTLVGDIS